MWRDNGHLAFHKEPDRGARFEVFFPKIDPCAAQVEAGVVETIRGGDEIVWVVDDDTMIAKIPEAMSAAIRQDPQGYSFNLHERRLLRSPVDQYTLRELGAAIEEDADSEACQRWRLSPNE